MSKTRAENEAPAHKYFTQMLNIAEDDLDPFQYRLLAHYVRWTGHGGESDESIRQAASATKMGVNKIRSTLQELETLKYIKVDRPTPQEARNGKTIHITILDRWMDNISRYQAVSKKIQDSPEPVSNQIHPPVSKKIRLEELGNEEQKERANALVSQPQTPATKPSPSKEGMGNGTKKRSEKSPKTVEGWLKRLPPVAPVVSEMLNACYEGWDKIMMTPENSLTVHQLENYITNAEEYIRLGGDWMEVREVYEYVADLVDYTIAPKTIAGYYLRWKASKKAEDSDKADKAYEAAKSHVETLMTDEQRKKRAEQMKADRIAIFGEKTA
jgi:hypothetical protein